MKGTVRTRRGAVESRERLVMFWGTRRPISCAIIPPMLTPAMWRFRLGVVGSSHLMCLRRSTRS